MVSKGIQVLNIHRESVISTMQNISKLYNRKTKLSKQIEYIKIKKKKKTIGKWSEKLQKISSMGLRGVSSKYIFLQL